MQDIHTCDSTDGSLSSQAALYTETTLDVLATSIGHDNISPQLVELHSKLSNIDSLRSNERSFINFQLPSIMDENIFLPIDKALSLEAKVTPNVLMLYVMHLEILASVQDFSRSFQITSKVISRMLVVLEKMTCALGDSLHSSDNELITSDIQVLSESSKKRSGSKLDGWLSLSQSSSRSSQANEQSQGHNQPRTISIQSNSRIWKLYFLNSDYSSASDFLSLSTVHTLTQLLSTDSSIENISESSSNNSESYPGENIQPSRKRRTFLEAHDEGVETAKFGSLPSSMDSTTSIVQVCLQNKFLNRMIEQIIEDNIKHLESPLLKCALQFIEDMSIHSNAVNTNERSSSTFEDYIHAIRFALSSLKANLDPQKSEIHGHDVLISLLRITLNLANEKTCLEIILGKVFLNMLRTLYIKYERAQTQDSTDILSLILCTFCSIIENGYRIQIGDSNSGYFLHLRRPNPSTLLRWFIKPSDFLFAMAKQALGDHHGPQISNDAKALSAYSGLLIGCLVGLYKAASLSSDTDIVALKVEFQGALEAACLEPRRIARLLQDFIVFQSEARVLTAQNLKSISSVIDDVVEYSDGL